MRIIELKGIKKTYYLEELNVPVLYGIDLVIEQGEFVVLLWGLFGKRKINAFEYTRIV
jgi:ABC-type lipoprotein export system ATPase subunit